jgi:hypothetical protein
MNRADRRRLTRLDVAVADVAEVVKREAQERFNIAFSIMIETVFESLRENRISAERANKILSDVSVKIIENGNDLAKAAVEKMEGKQ